MRDRLEWSDISMLRSFLIYLDTQCWQGKDADDVIFTEIHTALQHIAEQFRAPLDAKGVDLTSITEEVNEMIKYARCTWVDKDSYRCVWYRIASVPDSSEWKNAIPIARLLFSLPCTTAKVERVFSQLKLIKNDRRTKLKQTTLLDLMEVTVEGPAIADFSADSAIEGWWNDCATTRRVKQQPRKPYKMRRLDHLSDVNDHEESANEDELHFALDEWDWLSRYIYF